MDMNKLKDVAYKKNKDMPRYAVLITHNISIHLVRLLSRTPITPNQVTLLSVLMGILSGLSFSQYSPLRYLLGAILLEFYYVLDASDGQLARIKNQSSLTGAYFDYISNHIIHSLVFLSIGYGLFCYTSSILYLISGISAAWGILFMYGVHDARYSVLYNSGKSLSEGGNQDIPIRQMAKPSFAKKAFIFMHCLCRYPTIMNLITVFSLINLIFLLLGIADGSGLFGGLITFYAVAINIVWISKLSTVILKKELD